MPPGKLSRASPPFSQGTRSRIHPSQLIILWGSCSQRPLSRAPSASCSQRPRSATATNGGTRLLEQHREVCHALHNVSSLSKSNPCLIKCHGLVPQAVTVFCFSLQFRVMGDCLLHCGWCAKHPHLTARQAIVKTTRNPSGRHKFSQVPCRDAQSISQCS